MGTCSVCVRSLPSVHVTWDVITAVPVHLSVLHSVIQLSLGDLCSCLQCEWRLYNPSPAISITAANLLMFSILYAHRSGAALITKVKINSVLRSKIYARLISWTRRWRSSSIQGYGKDKPPILSIVGGPGARAPLVKYQSHIELVYHRKPFMGQALHYKVYRIEETQLYMLSMVI